MLTAVLSFVGKTNPLSEVVDEYNGILIRPNELNHINSATGTGTSGGSARHISLTK